MQVSAATPFNLWPRLSRGRGAAAASRASPRQHAEPNPLMHTQIKPIVLRQEPAQAVSPSSSNSSSSKRQHQQQQQQQHPVPCVPPSHLLLPQGSSKPSPLLHPLLVLPSPTDKNAFKTSSFPEPAGTSLRGRPPNNALLSAASCSSRSSSSSSRSSSSSLPIIVESSASDMESGADEEEGEGGWIEVALPEAPLIHSSFVVPATNISLEHQTENLLCSSPALERLVGVLNFNRGREASKSMRNRQQQHDTSGPDASSATAAAATEAAAAGTPGIVALHAELLQLSREARRQRRALRGADESAESSESVISSSSSNTSGTPRTGSSLSNSRFPVWLLQRRRFSSRSCDDLRCMYTPNPRPKRSASFPAPAHLNCFNPFKNPSLIHRRAQPSRHWKMLQQRLQGHRRPCRTGVLQEDVDARCAPTTATAAPAAAKEAPASAVRLLKAAARRDGSFIHAQAAEWGTTALAAASALCEQSRRELRARDAVVVLQQEKERRELQQCVFWWFGSDIFLPQL
ncbi:hypothetical protein ACSSS7_003410 [Eimeria intestinalis]